MKINEQWNGKTLTISGFGRISEINDKPKFSKLLQFANVDILKSDDCFKDKFDTDILKFPPKGWDKMKTQRLWYKRFQPNIKIQLHEQIRKNMHLVSSQWLTLWCMVMGRRQHS